jgi:hypothetical protein
VKHTRDPRETWKDKEEAEEVEEAKCGQGQVKQNDDEKLSQIVRLVTLQRNVVA